MSAKVASLAGHRLLILEAAINVSQKYFVDAGESLAEIQDAQLYQEAGFGSFEAYCAERWDMSRARAYQLIAAASVYGACLQLSTTEPPRNEAQCRELAKLEAPEQQREAWQRAVDTAPDGKVTAKHVATVVKAMLPVVGGKDSPSAYNLEAAATRILRMISEVVDRCPDELREDLIEVMSYKLEQLQRKAPVSVPPRPFPRAATPLLPAPALGFDPYEPRPPDGDDDLPEDAALILLGLRWNFTSKTLQAVFKKKAREAHPDRGGSHDEAAKINAAFELLKRVLEVVEPVEQRQKAPWKKAIRGYRDIRRQILRNERLDQMFGAKRQERNDPQ